MWVYPIHYVRFHFGLKFENETKTWPQLSLFIMQRQYHIQDKTESQKHIASNRKETLYFIQVIWSDGVLDLKKAPDLIPGVDLMHENYVNDDHFVNIGRMELNHLSLNSILLVYIVFNLNFHYFTCWSSTSCNPEDFKRPKPLIQRRSCIRRCWSHLERGTRDSINLRVTISIT